MACNLNFTVKREEFLKVTNVLRTLQK